MKYIVKGAEPQAFAAWKSMENENWKPTYSTLSGDAKKAIKNALMMDQGGICCYCERRLSPEDSHIEHFKPQGRHDPLDYSNMLCSCLNQIEKGAPLHCGHLKDKWFDPTLLVSPLTPDCEQRFVFYGNGDIIPADDKDLATAETIDRLGLNIPKLRAMRAGAIEPFLDDSITLEEMRSHVHGYLAKDTENQFSEFWTTIRYLFREYVSE